MLPEETQPDKKKGQKKASLASKERKYKISLLAMFFITMGFLATAFVPPLAPGFDSFIWGVLGAAGLYSGINVASKWVQKGKEPPPEE